MTKRESFLKDVMHEVKQLRKYATKKEKNNLTFSRLSYINKSRCIYGQLTGDCESKRAKSLMNKSCIRVMDLGENRGTLTIDGKSITSKEFKINGEYAAQTWSKEKYPNGHYVREYRYLSALEAYICTKGAKNDEIIAYIKGETSSLEL